MGALIDVDEVLVDVQNSIRGRLISDRWYAGIEIFTPDDVTQGGRDQTPADISQRVAQALSAAKQGLCLLVSAPLISGFSPDPPDLHAERCALLVRIIEMPLVNRGSAGTRKTISAAGIHTLRRLWHHVHLGATFVPVSAGLVPSEIKGALVWDINYNFTLDLATLEPSGG